MRNIQTLGISALILLLSAPSFAQSQSQQNAPQTPASPNDKTPKVAPDVNTAEVRPLSTNCYTNQPGCEGFTTYGPFSYDVGCSLWYNNGANGRANFTIPANQSHEERVRYNDTGACIAIQYAPPRDQPRYFLWVHN